MDSRATMLYLQAQSCVGIKQTNEGCLSSWCKQGVLLLNTVYIVYDCEDDPI